VGAGERLAYPRWDFAVELTGPVHEQIRAAFDTQWQRIELGHRPDLMKTLQARLRSQAARWRGRKVPTLTEPSVAFVARDNVVNRRAIEKAYLVAIGRAHREILLANPYFMPGRKLRRALVAAARRGVDVRLLIGRKEFVTLDYAVRYLYRTLLTAGVRIAEYEKTILHGKVAVVDSNWATVGSSNLDALSLVLNNEANVVLVEHPEIGALREAILTAFSEARPMDTERDAARPFFERLMNWLAYSSYRMLMKLLTVGGYD
jgi:cardiolipin synthase